ncbi:NADPH-dependent FMN reductase [Brucella pituitosa]|uniref:NADPH-dependent FMN reductase n=1 Tax=Brucella pituitosa TaxID=571256 RepID=UPI003C71B6D0
MQKTPIRLAVIIGSNREGRIAPTIGKWFLGQVKDRPEFEVDYIDLADINLPAVLPEKLDDDLKAYTARLDAADAFVMVVPEYNHSYPASLKQAIDLGYDEWRAKPIGFVSYGGFAAGVRSVEHLRGVFPELHTVTVRDTVSFQNAWDQFDEKGVPHNPAGCAAAAGTMLHQLKWWAEALRTARNAVPYTVTE